MAKAHVLGYPRIGGARELKKAVESYWNGTTDQAQLLEVGNTVKQKNWKVQSEMHLNYITVGDFAWYDNMLEMSILLGNIPERFSTLSYNSDIDLGFDMARGCTQQGKVIDACEMTKWFNTNYHYIVPEFTLDQTFTLNATQMVNDIKSAQALGYHPKPVIIGPLSYLWLGKLKGVLNPDKKLELLKSLVACYVALLTEIKALSIDWIQIDEPILALDLPVQWRDQFASVYHDLAASQLKILLASYFGGIRQNLSAIRQLPVEGYHVDLSTVGTQHTAIVDQLSVYQVLSCGVINGRNIWITDLQEKFKLLENIQNKIGNDRVWVAPSCSLLHVPVDLDPETALDPEVKSWMAFSKQKLKETVILCQGLNQGQETIADSLEQNQKILRTRKSSACVYNKAVHQAMDNLDPSWFQRAVVYEKRAVEQKKLQLPLFPTTTIGSFPQTQDIRLTRRAFKSEQITEEAYEAFLQKEIQQIIKKQEAIGLDVLVHGEPERNDMVEYFGELLSGFLFTEQGWVQSYGTRCVKPPVIYGDISRPEPMTVKWSQYAQSLTRQKVKGMLTGPVTILAWSFVRDDQPIEETAFQVALALRQEVCDLETAGLEIIQIDEPAFRESLPLQKKDQEHYLDWAVRAFRLSVCGVANSTQIHTHMCYSEFNELIQSIADLDADVISIEASRSDMELLAAFEDFEYPNEIGPGVYDIHSPNVPDTASMVELLKLATKKLRRERIWVNPDCGLKTRNWEEVEASLKNMVEAAWVLRKQYRSEVA